MSTERTVRTILCVLVWVVHTLAAGQDPFHRSFTMEDGLPSNKVYRAIQDHEGFMWFATDNGVARFDGLEFTVLGLEDGLVDTEVIMIQEDHEHRIWFMGLNGKLAYWKDGQVYNERNDPRLKGLYATAGWSTMAVDKKGAIWFGALSGESVRVDMTQGTHRYIGGSILKRNICQDAHGAIISISGGSFHHLSGDSAVLVHHVLTTLHSTHIYPSDQPGKDPLVMIDGRLHEVSASGIEPLHKGPLLDPLVHRSVLRTRTGDLWLHRHDRGVDRVEPTGEGYGPVTHFFNDRTITMVFTDRSGDHWFCSASRGVVLMSREQLKSTSWMTGKGISDGMMTAIEQGVDRVWIGTDQGRVLMYKNDSLLAFKMSRQKVLSGRVLRILSEQDGNTWFGTDYSLFHWGPERPHQLDYVLGLSGTAKPTVWTAVKALMKTRAGTLLTGGIGVHRVGVRDGVLARYTWLDDSYLRFRIRCLGEDPGGVIWAGVQSGLLELYDDRAVVHTLPDSIMSSEVVDLATIGKDSLLLATNGNGLILWSAGRTLKRIGQAEGLPSLNIRHMRTYGDTVWCATPSGVVALILKGGRVSRSWIWSMDQGLPTNDTFDMLVSNGELFIISDEGLGISAVVPGSDDDLLGPLHVARVKVNDDHILYPVPSRSVLKRGDRFRVDVHALEFVRARAVEYAYSMDHSNVWHACRHGQVILDGPTDGVHRISFRARLPNGPWTEAITVEYEVVPPWWARRWVIGSGALVAMIGLFLVLRRYERERYKRRLATVKAEMALNEERRRIAADVHDDLGADLSKLLLQVRRAGTAPDDHELRVSEGVMAAINKIDEIIWSLDPKRDSLESTISYVERYAIELCEANGSAFNTSVDLPHEQVPLSATVRREVLLIAKEAIRNAVEHASASVLYLRVGIQGEVVHISFEDDGIGILISGASSERNGLKNMRDRASKLQGMIVVDQRYPSGTRVDLHFPLPKRST